MKTIGILGGMGPLASADLYQKITKNTCASKDQEHLHILIDSNPAIPDRTGFLLSGGEDPLPELLRTLHRLEKAGAELLLLPCNTAHFFYPQLQEAAGVPILNMLEETANYLATQMPGEVFGVLSTDGTLQTGILSHYLDAHGLAHCCPEQTQPLVMQFIYEGIKKNNFTLGTAGLMQAAAELRQKGATKFILGCTELSVAASIYPFSNDFVDPLLILARRAIQAAGGKVIS